MDAFESLWGSAPTAAAFRAHLCALHGLPVDTTALPAPTSIRAFHDCEYHTYRVVQPGMAGAAQVAYCFDRKPSCTSSAAAEEKESKGQHERLALGAVHVTGDASPLRTWQLPHNLQLDHTGRAVIQALGEPERKGGASVAGPASANASSGVWMAWDRLGVQVELCATDWEQPDARIREITLYTPTK
ncbi:hypothetical protein THASP1DRAFT_32579 [Thamnocephalis sphaerospora]|uniref:Uncharacterized protein n=1 Tax=Thamnocephalis sphaerospora TaxID=78915 RepID=A0A4P9XIN9_9FUNG|nr:hypothetical protein THASP1DRAFT_32579 [Thamnocephalis sphaerospora]|eukprot:RKP05583.1 hypothetical protein THASP1DRAFT_32579 [Thamnocephalis sphaerospora]